MSVIEYQNHIKDQLRRVEETHAEWVRHTDECADGLSCPERKSLERREMVLRNTLSEIKADAPSGTTIWGFVELSNGRHTPAYMIKSLLHGSPWNVYVSVGTRGHFRRATETQAERFRVTY